jgi:membrane protein DedA with SNARE-associated domain
MALDRNVRGFMYFLAAQVQAATLILGGYWLGKELDKKQPWSQSWLMVIMPLALVIIAHTFYTVIRFMLKKEKK